MIDQPLTPTEGDLPNSAIDYIRLKKSKDWVDKDLINAFDYAKFSQPEKVALSVCFYRFSDVVKKVRELIYEAAGRV
jgi:hypothetical protein